MSTDSLVRTGRTTPETGHDLGEIETGSERDPLALRMLLPIDDAAARDESLAGTEHVVRLVGRALRSERRRGRAGHWSYGLHRHLALARLYRDERARLARLRRAVGRG